MPIDSDKFNGGAKSAKLPDLNRPQRPETQTSQLKSDCFSKAQESAQESVKAVRGELVSKNQEQLLKLTDALDKAENNRHETIDKLSDRMAYLQDEGLFMSDLLGATQYKLNRVAPTAPKNTVTVTVIDALIESFATIAEWDMPQIGSSNTAGGALPAAF